MPNFSLEARVAPGALDDWLTEGNNNTLRLYVDIDGKERVARGYGQHKSAMITGEKDYSGSRIALRKFRFAPVSTRKSFARKDDVLGVLQLKGQMLILQQMMMLGSIR